MEPELEEATNRDLSQSRQREARTAQKKADDILDATEGVKDNPEDVVCKWHRKCQPNCCQCFARPSCLLLWLCLSAFVQGLVVNGFVNSVLITLELRYDLTSTESGLIASMYDIGSLVSLLPVTYIGHWYKRSRLISIGMIIMSVGSFVFSIPQFTISSYDYQSPVSPLCYLSGYAYPKFCSKESLNRFKFVFWLSQFLHGVGASPLYTLGVVYLDDNLTIPDSGTFLGVYYTMSIIGPAVGFLLGSQFLRIFVEPGVKPADLSPDNASLWVGAWWLGFLVSGLLTLIVVVPMLGFPMSFPGSASIRSQRKREVHNQVEFQHVGVRLNARDFASSLSVLIKNPALIFLSLASAMQMLVLAGLSIFGPKILQTLFYFTQSQATIVVGLLTASGSVLGMLGGGLLIRFTNLSLGRLLWFFVGSAILNAFIALGLLLKCEEQNFAGVNYNYPLTPNQPNSLSAMCNMNCNCQDSKFMYSPVCGADSVIYYSPCYAGCVDNGTVIDGVRHYASCSCISGHKTVQGGNFSAIHGISACRSKACDKTTAIIATLFLFSTCTSSLAVPILQSTLRVIPATLKDLGLGLQWVIIRLLGGIPGPLVLGKLIDASCSLWTHGCGLMGSCSFYNGRRFWLTVLLFTIVVKLLEVFFLAMAAFLYVPPREDLSRTPKVEKLRDKRRRK